MFSLYKINDVFLATIDTPGNYLKVFCQEKRNEIPDKNNHLKLYKIKDGTDYVYVRDNVLNGAASGEPIWNLISKTIPLETRDLNLPQTTVESHDLGRGKTNKSPIIIKLQCIKNIENINIISTHDVFTRKSLKSE